MAAIMFDTHAFVKELTDVGMPEPQAAVLARTQATLIDETLVTKNDLKVTEECLRQELRELELRLTIRIGSMLVVAIGVVVALVKLL